jgi:hypothetical protein
VGWGYNCILWRGKGWGKISRGVFQGTSQWKDKGTKENYSIYQSGFPVPCSSSELRTLPLGISQPLHWFICQKREFSVVTGLLPGTRLSLFTQHEELNGQQPAATSVLHSIASKDSCFVLKRSQWLRCVSGDYALHLSFSPNIQYASIGLLSYSCTHYTQVPSHFLEIRGETVTRLHEDRNGRSVELTSQLRQMAGWKILELYLHSLSSVHGAVLN